MSKEVQKYVNKQRSPQKQIVQKLRKLILKTFPKINESMRFGVPWYEDKYYIVALKDHVNLGFSVKGLSKKEKGLLEGKGSYMRHIKFFSVKEIEEKKIIKILKIVYKKYRPCH